MTATGLSDCTAVPVSSSCCVNWTYCPWSSLYDTLVPAGVPATPGPDTMVRDGFTVTFVPSVPAMMTVVGPARGSGIIGGAEYASATT